MNSWGQKVQRCSGCLESCSSVSLESSGKAANIWGFVEVRVIIWIYWTQDSGYMKSLRLSVSPWTPTPRSWSVIVLTDKFPLPSLVLGGSTKPTGSPAPSQIPQTPTSLLSSLPPAGPLSGRVIQHCFLTFFPLTLSLNSCYSVFRWYQCMRKISKNARSNIFRKGNTFYFAF